MEVGSAISHSRSDGENEGESYGERKLFGTAMTTALAETLEEAIPFPPGVLREEGRIVKKRRRGGKSPISGVAIDSAKSFCFSCDEVGSCLLGELQAGSVISFQGRKGYITGKCTHQVRSVKD